MTFSLFIYVTHQFSMHFTIAFSPIKLFKIGDIVPLFKKFIVKKKKNLKAFVFSLAEEDV